MFLYSPFIGLLWQLTYLTTNSTQIFFLPWFPWPWHFHFFFYLFGFILWLLLYLELNLPQNYFKYHFLLIYHFLFYSLSCVQFFCDLITEAHQAPLSMGFPRQKYWSELQFPSTGDLPDPGRESPFPALPGGFFIIESPGKTVIGSGASLVAQQ